MKSIRLAKTIDANQQMKLMIIRCLVTGGMLEKIELPLDILLLLLVVGGCCLTEFGEATRYGVENGESGRFLVGE